MVYRLVLLLYDTTAGCMTYRIVGGGGGSGRVVATVARSTQLGCMIPGVCCIEGARNAVVGIALTDGPCGGSIAAELSVFSGGGGT